MTLIYVVTHPTFGGEEMLWVMWFEISHMYTQATAKDMFKMMAVENTLYVTHKTNNLQPQHLRKEPKHNIGCFTTSPVQLSIYSIQCPRDSQPSSTKWRSTCNRG